ncbi:MAG: hypothetical protein AAGE96_21740 [Cyanobacteria bacterium P01_G01_bin.19]
MVNFSFTLTTLLGLLDIVGAIYYLCLTVGTDLPHITTIDRVI